MVTILNGPTGTELIRRGHDLAGDAWSAVAIEHAPRTLGAIHAEYAAAGATVHTACTFRTQPRMFPTRFAELTRKAVNLCREAVPRDHRVAGSLAPVMDCYQPAEAPSDDAARAGHEAMADALAAAGVDLILCETFPSTREGLLAVRAAAKTGVPVWLSLTAGPSGSLMSPAELAFAAREAAALGAQAVLVNCVAARLTEDYVRALAQALAGVNAAAGVPVRVGAFANAGEPDEALGWQHQDEAAAARYAQFARRWVDAGATIIGSCCGTGPAHTRALTRELAAALTR